MSEWHSLASEVVVAQVESILSPYQFFLPKKGDADDHTLQHPRHLIKRRKAVQVAVYRIPWSFCNVAPMTTQSLCRMLLRFPCENFESMCFVFIRQLDNIKLPKPILQVNCDVLWIGFGVADKIILVSKRCSPVKDELCCTMFAVLGKHAQSIEDYSYVSIIQCILRKEENISYTATGGH